MKKFLFASTALILTAGFASADVTISGYGRTGVLYQEDGVRADRIIRDTAGNITSVDESADAIVQSRLRMNIDASTSSDAGVDFGGRIRIQWDQGDRETTVAPGYLYVTSSGLRVEIGNSNTAYDSAALLYRSEIGVYSRSFGNSRGNFFAYNTDGYPGYFNLVDRQNDVRNDYLGIFASYSFGDINVMASVVDPDQIYGDMEKEYSVAASYDWNDFQFSAAYLMNGAGIEDNDQFFLGAGYAYNEIANVGVLYYDNGEQGGSTRDQDLGKTITLYGDYMVAPMTTINGYIAHNDADINETDNAYGIGGKYDLGGAFLAGSVQRGYNELVTADMGVRFDF